MSEEEVIEVYQGERLMLMAKITAGEVRFGLISRERRHVGWWDWGYPRVGYVSPRETGFLWWRKTQRSVGEAMQEVMGELHRREFLMREGEAQVEATRASIRVLAEIEKELSA